MSAQFFLAPTYLAYSFYSIEDLIAFKFVKFCFNEWQVDKSIEMHLYVVKNIVVRVVALF